MKPARPPGSERHIPRSLWLMLGLFLMTYFWPAAPVGRRACQGLQATGADDAVAAGAAASITQAAAVITLSTFLAGWPTATVHHANFPSAGSGGTTVTALIPVTLMLLLLPIKISAPLRRSAK